MEKRHRSIGLAEVFLIVGLLLSCPRRLSALSVTVNDLECVYEFVPYEGDTVSGNFVVVDHDIFWGSDHPGIDLIVSDANSLCLRTKKVYVFLFDWMAELGGLDLDLRLDTAAVFVTSPAGNTVHTMKGTSGDKFDFKAPRAGMYKFCFNNPNRTPETVSFYIHVGHIPNEHDLAKDANESTRKRLTFYTVMEYLVLACASGLQVVYIRRLFNRSVAYNRV
ncbi:hypothetical protein BHE74_00052797 [Ensete ventricosum]|uniref:GOLD domain-containing protein n=1 Tax=Ensete ventricosum TaxID=4639 RepID=A0A426XS40_ENSVE|nr:hypothetical protein B296_00044416 [Ensete ventricosum]RWW41701.1 hypothetical protein BHE74_00052797 [Ensete ventricosum]